MDGGTKRNLNETENDTVNEPGLDPNSVNFFEHPTKSNDSTSIWVHFLKSTTCYTKCKLCGRHTKLYGASSTSGMLSHLQSAHKEEYDRLKDAQEEAKKSKKPSTSGNRTNWKTKYNALQFETASQNNHASISSNHRQPTASSSAIASEELDQFLGFDYNDVIVGNQGNGTFESVSSESQQNEPTGSAFPRADHNAISGNTLKLEQINHNINTLLKHNNLSKEPNYNFVISQLEMLRCVKSENDLAVLKAKIYKLIADTIAGQQ